MPHSSSDEVVRQYRDHLQKQVAECAKRAAKKILAKMKGEGRSPDRSDLDGIDRRGV